MLINDAIVLRIKELCKEHNLTINGLAVKADIKQSTLDNIVRGNSTNPQIKTLALIAKAFDMDIVEFLNTDYIIYSTIW